MSETDPWKVAKSTIRARIADYSVALLGHSSGSQQAKENAQTAIDVAIDAARAAEAAQHQQEIAAKDAMIAQLEENIARQAGYMLAADARLAAVEAERDRLKAALAKADEALKRITAGQEDCGDPGTECPLHDAHKTWHPVSEALAMIAALTPQGQSTDGETR